MFFNNQNYKERIFSGFYIARNPGGGPGWFIYGRNCEEYGKMPDGRGAYVMLCGARTKPKRHVHYNCPVAHGWRTKREADAALATLLERYPQLKRGKVATIALADF